MKFRLSETASWIKDKVEKEKLEKYGFKFEKIGNMNMWEEIRNYNLTIKINTIKDLKNLINDFHRLVISADEIEIYNDFRE